MFLEIVTPEATLFSGEVESVAVPGVTGEFQMLKDHAPIISILKEGFVKIYGDKKNKGTWLAINSGTIELKDNKVIVLAD